MAGRILISGVIVFTLFAIVVTNLPPASHLHHELSRITGPYVNAVGLDQNWGVFAPEPRQQALGLEARITYRDGTAETWKLPRRNAFVGSYSDYRWRKLMENLASSTNLALGLDLAHWIARETPGRAGPPANVTLIKRVANLSPPGPQAGEPLRFREIPIVDADIDAGDLKGRD